MQLRSLFLPLVFLPLAARAEALFDMEAIRDGSTLETKVIQDWQPAPKLDGVKQKLIEITVCEWWSGQKVRLPVTFLVPEVATPCDKVVVGNMPPVLKMGRVSGGMLELLTEHGVGMVLVGMSTIDAMEPKWQLHLGMKEQLLATKDPRYTPAWIWGMSDMRALTAAMAEPEAFQPKKVIATGGSKRGVGASICGIHDDRFTGIFPVVAPMLASPGGAFVRGSALKAEAKANAAFMDQLSLGPNPLGLPESTRASLEARDARRGTHAITVEQAEAAGWTREEMLEMNDRVWEACLITKHLDVVEERKLDFLYHVGTNDNVCPGLAELGERFPGFPVFILPGGQHGGPRDAGFTLQTPSEPEASENLMTFARAHFKGEWSWEGPPTTQTSWDPTSRELTITATLSDSGASDENRLSWCVDRHAPYTLAAEYDRWESKSMEAVAGREVQAVVTVPEGVSRLDFVTTHRLTMDGRVLNVSSPYGVWKE